MIRHEFVLAVALGVVLALPYVLYARRVRDRRRVFGIGLVAAAGVYVLFAVFAGTRREWLIESGGVVLFGILAVLGMRWSAWFLALGWAAHVGWDLLLHPVNVSSYAPWWYPVICIGFDLVVAGAILGGPAPYNRRYRVHPPRDGVSLRNPGSGVYFGAPVRGRADAAGVARGRGDTSREGRQ